MARSPIRVAIINDYPIVVTGLAELFRHYPGVQIEQLSINERHVHEDIDVVLYDVFAVDRRHITIPSSLRPKPSQLRIVLFGWDVDMATIRDGLNHGVDGYISKGLPASAIADAIQRVHSGEQVVVGAGKDTHPVGDWPGRSEGLTMRESEIIAFVTQGLSNDEIAKRCYLSVNTIKVYLRKAYRKMHVSRRAEAVAWGASHGFRPVPLEARYKFIYTDRGDHTVKEG